MPRRLHILALLAALVLLTTAVFQTQAIAPGNPAFQRTWERTDQPVASGAVARTWIWGPEATTGILDEPYSESSNGMRKVQYYDKSRMEINDPSADPNSPFFVTNGLLVVELMSGRLQLGNDQFAEYPAAQVNVAGDPDDPLTYADLAPLRSAPAAADGAPLTQRVDGNGNVTNDPSLAGQGVTAAHRVQVPGIDHQVASPFWTFLNSTGPALLNGQLVTERLFDPWFYATGLPITEAYFANVKVGGTLRLVLLQCFERRCLTYTPGNPTGFLVEAGNVGQHYHLWRYELILDGTPTATTTGTPPTATSTSTASSTASVTATATVETAPEYAYVTEWGTAFVPIVPMQSPRGVEVDGNDNLWVIDTWHDRLVQFDEHGIFMRIVGLAGDGDGQFNHPQDAAFSDDGRLFVADTDNHRVQVFTADGVYLTQFGVPGVGNGQLLYPMGIDIQDNVVYVADTGNDRIQLYSLEGVYAGYFGSTGSGDGQLDAPAGLVVDSGQFVYVADSANNRVEVFRTGSYMFQFGGSGSGNGQFSTPWGIDLDDEGNIYVTDADNYRVQKFSADGAYLTQWGAYGVNFGEFDYPLGLALDSQGNVYVVCEGNHRVQKFTSAGAFLFEIFDNRRGTFSVPTGIAVDQNGNILTVDGHDDVPSISRYTPEGNPLDSLSRSRPFIGELDVLHGVAVNAAGEIYVTDRVTNWVQRFSATWGYLGQWGAPGANAGQFNGPTAIVTDADGNVYVADSGNDRIQKFQANGSFLGQWGSFGSGNGQFNDPQGIAIDGERVYVTDFNNNRVQVFNLDGEYITQFGTTANGLEPLDRPLGIAVNPDGYVLVVEFGHSRFHIFTADGESVGTFGSAGSGPGQFNVPYAIACDDAGNVYVTDINNHRVQKFAPVN